jgi:hypothetical protein
MSIKNVILSAAKDLACNKFQVFTVVCHWLCQCKIDGHAEHWPSQWHARDTFAQIRELR